MKINRLAILLFILLVRIMYCKAQLPAKQDTNSIIILNQKAWKIRNTDLETAKQLAVEAINSANKIKYSRGLSYSFNVLGHYFKVKGSYDSAEYYYRRSFVIREKLRDTIQIARSYRNLMSIDKLRGNYSRAIRTGLLAIQILTPKLDYADALKESAWLQVNLASLYDKTGDFNKAIVCAIEGKKLFIEQQDEEGIAAAAMNLGAIYETQKQYNKALEEYNFAIKSFSLSNNKRELAKALVNTGSIYLALNNYTLALTDYKLGLEIQLENDFQEDIKNSFHNVGLIFEKIGVPDSAVKYYNKALSLSIGTGNIEGQYEAHRSLAAISNLRKDHEKAISHLLQSLNLSIKSSAIPQKIILLQEISNTYKSAGKLDSALFYSNEYVHLNDSLNSILRNSITLASDLREKEYELILSKEENKKQIIVIISILVAFTLILIIFLMYYFAEKAKKRELKLKQIIKEKELIALDSMLEGQEKERKRLAAELHDTIGSILSATKYTFKAMENSMEKLLEENKIQYNKINHMLDEAMESVRRISHNMMEGILTEKGLEGALTELCETFEKPGKIKFTLNMLGFGRRMGYTTESNIYRIIQELMTNIIKHSHAHNVNIQLIKSKENINLLVEDDGKGFNPDEAHAKKGIGISNINDRVKKLSGNWSIDSGKGKGTTIIIDIPLNEEIL